MKNEDESRSERGRENIKAFKLSFPLWLITTSYNKKKTKTQIIYLCSSLQKIKINKTKKIIIKSEGLSIKWKSVNFMCNFCVEFEFWKEIHIN